MLQRTFPGRLRKTETVFFGWFPVWFPAPRKAQGWESLNRREERPVAASIRHVGGKHVRVADDDGYLFPMLIMYPTSVPAESVTFGPFDLDMAANAQPLSERVPVVIISHGSGGTHLGYLELARRLVRAGHVVLMPEHPGNNRGNNELADSSLNLTNRPRHLTLALDRLLADPLLTEVADGNRTAVVGHSMGGYTALAIAGGRPSTQDGQAVDVPRDDRVRALVLLAPATPWFSAPGALDDVHVPILMLTGERDQIMPPYHAELVRRGLPEDVPLEHQVVGNAGHFSFMSPFPDVMRSPDFAPGNDPEGFDRAAFQDRLAADVVTFLDRSL